MSKTEKATFAGGCFWCMVEPFDERPGIIEVISGYTGGTVANPTYEQVCSNTTGHVEAVQITYDPEIVSYKELVELYRSEERRVGKEYRYGWRRGSRTRVW